MLFTIGNYKGVIIVKHVDGGKPDCLADELKKDIESKFIKLITQNKSEDTFIMSCAYQYFYTSNVERHAPNNEHLLKHAPIQFNIRLTDKKGFISITFTDEKEITSMETEIGYQMKNNFNFY